MYRIIANDDFIDTIMQMPLRKIHSLTNSFVSVKKIDDNDASALADKKAFLNELLEKIENR